MKPKLNYDLKTGEKAGGDQEDINLLRFHGFPESFYGSPWD